MPRRRPTTQCCTQRNWRCCCNMCGGTKRLSAECRWSVLRLSVRTHSNMSFFQGGGIAAAFTAHFPQLVDENIVLIASAGIMDVGPYLRPSRRVLTPHCLQSSDISRTAKFMSSPLIQTLASSGPVRVRGTLLYRLCMYLDSWIYLALPPTPRKLLQFSAKVRPRTRVGA